MGVGSPGAREMGAGLMGCWVDRKSWPLGKWLGLPWVLYSVGGWPSDRPVLANYLPWQAEASVTPKRLGEAQEQRTQAA